MAGRDALLGPSETEPRPTMLYTRHEELLHALTHGMGLALAAVGSVALVLRIFDQQDPWSALALGVFALTLCLAYFSSTCYHAASERKTKASLRALDHVAIYLLIAGTYTPLALIPLRGAVGFGLAAFVWVVAALGILLRLRVGERFQGAALWLYLAMGWSAVLALGPLTQRLDDSGLALVVLGGAAYSVGVVFYAWRRLPYNHLVWHLFVMLGSGLHYFAMLRLA